MSLVHSVGASSSGHKIPTIHGFNPAIQGLRGVAIFLVVLNHVGVPGFGGGFIGVDIFFVISGYLIGGLLLRELSSTGRIDLWSFYARRCRRLLPACLVLLVAVMAGVLWLYAPFEHRELMSSVRASAVYALNLWLTGRATDYFGGHTEAIPVLHLWSLAVEEQFYIAWPLLMLAAAALFRGDVRRTTTGLVLVAGAVSLAACVLVTDIKVQWAFYSTPTRVWEFCAGMWIATRPTHSRGLGDRSMALLGLVCLGVIVAASVWFGPQIRFPGWWALLPVAAAVGLLVVAERPSDVWTARLLRVAPLRWLGDCSYSVYLWHWPLLIFAFVMYPRGSAVVTAAVVVLTVLIGWLSYRFIEVPFKSGLLPQWSARRLVGVALGISVSVAVAAHMLGQMQLDSRQARFREAASWPAAESSGCLVLLDAVDQPPCEFGSATPTATVVLFGDSHAMQWFTPLKAMAERNAWRLVVLAKANCPSVDVVVKDYVSRKDNFQCSRWRENMFTRIGKLQPDVVVLASSSGHPTPIDTWKQGIDSTVRRLRATGTSVVYVRDTPFANFDVPTCLSRADWRGVAMNVLCTYPLEVEQARYGKRAEAESVAVQSAGGRFLDFTAAICDQPNCPTEGNGVILFKDRNHITEAFARQLAPNLEAPLIDMLEKKERPSSTAASGVAGHVVLKK